jgi:hypothetical protein
VYSSITERLLSNGLQLGLYIPEQNCTDCVINEYEKLLKLPDYIQDKIFILTSFSKSRDVKLWLNSHKYKYPIYNSAFLEISNQEVKNQLLLFLVNETGIPSNFFILESSLLELSDNYYNYIISKFKKENGTIIDEEITSTGEKPEIKVANKHDFGEIDQNKKVFTFFEFENSSSIPFVITNVTTDCGCTVSEWDSKPAKKGEKLKVKVEFTAESTGFFSKKIFVFSNAKGSPHTLRITGSVK